MDAQQQAQVALSDAISNAREQQHERAEYVLRELCQWYARLAVSKSAEQQYRVLAEMASAIEHRLRAGNWSTD